jgi:hypothetical protein
VNLLRISSLLLLASLLASVPSTLGAVEAKLGLGTSKYSLHGMDQYGMIGGVVRCAHSSGSRSTLTGGAPSS